MSSGSKQTKLRPPTDRPEWPEPTRIGYLLIGSDISIRVLGYIKNWGFHPVVLRKDDDTEPPRYFWEDPTDCFKPKELRERFRGWVPMPPEPGNAAGNEPETKMVEVPEDALMGLLSVISQRKNTFNLGSNELKDWNAIQKHLNQADENRERGYLLPN